MPLFTKWRPRSAAPEIEKKYSKAGQLLAYGQLGRAKWTPCQYDALAEQGYRRNVIAFRCVQEIAQSAASVTLLLFEKDKEVNIHPALKILQKPNPLQSRMAFLEAVYSHILITGNAYIEKVSNAENIPAELWCLRPDRMKVIAGGQGMPLGYEYSLAGKSKRWAADPLTGASDILHLRRFHPLHDWYGMGAMESAAQAIDQYNTAANWNQALLQNGCRPSGALLVESGKDNSHSLTEEQFERLKTELEFQYSGSNNAGKPLLLEGGLKWVDMMLSPKDMDFQQMKNSAAREIALAFGYPPMLLGIAGDNTYNNQ